MASDPGEWLPVCCGRAEILVNYGDVEVRCASHGGSAHIVNGDAHLRAEVRREMLKELECVAQDFEDWKAEDWNAPRCAKHLREWMKVEREGQ